MALPFLFSAGAGLATKLASGVGQKQQIEQQTSRAVEAARERFNPDQLNPLLELFGKRAQEGIPDEAEDIRRRQAVESLFGRGDIDLTGSRRVAQQQALTESQQGALSDFETQLSLADIQAQQEGELQFAQTQSQREQLVGQREAAIEEAELMGQAELSRRRDAATAGAVNVFSQLATTPFGEDGTTPLEQLFAGGDKVDVGEQLAETARAGVPNEKPEDVILEDPLTQEDLNLGENISRSTERLSLPQQGETVSFGATGQPDQGVIDSLISSAEDPQDPHDLRVFFRSLAQDGESPAGVMERLFGGDSTQQDLPFNVPFVENAVTGNELDFTDIDFGMAEQQEQEDELLGRRLSDPISTFLRNTLGRGGQIPFETVTTIPRAGLNLIDLFGQEYKRALEIQRAELGQ